MERKEHLTYEGLNAIQSIANGMNQTRKMPLALFLFIHLFA